MQYIHPIPECTLEVLEVIKDDELWLDELARMSMCMVYSEEILKN